MRIRVTFEISGDKFPVDYRRAFLHVLKDALSTYENGMYFRDFFPETCPQRKEYAFAVGLPAGSVYRGAQYDLGGSEISLTLTTGNHSHFIVLYNAFRRLKGKEYPFLAGVSGHVVSVFPVTQLPLKHNKILVEFLAPLCVREHVDRKDRYFSVEEPEFCNQVRRVVSYQLAGKAWATERMLDDFQIFPYRMKKTVAQFYGKYVECSLGSAVLCGEPRLLEELYDNGIGSRCSSGFGVFHILSI